MTLLVTLRPVARRRLLGRRRDPEALESLALGDAFFAVLAQAPPGWTRTLDLVRAVPATGVVFGRLQARMSVTELSRISPYAADEPTFAAFRALVARCAAAEDLELAFTPAS